MSRFRAKRKIAREGIRKSHGQGKCKTCGQYGCSSCAKPMQDIDASIERATTDALIPLSMIAVAVRARKKKVQDTQEMEK